MAACRTESGVYDEIVSARLDCQLATLGASFEVHRAALTVSEPIGAVLESLLADGFALALAELKADSGKGIALARAPRLRARRRAAVERRAAHGDCREASTST